MAFDFLNGLHDAANSIATIVSTRVLSPRYAVAWAAFFNFIAFLFFGLQVAQTVGTGIVSPNLVDDRLIFGALMGAISWNVITWAAGIPSSSSHALIGGLVGAGLAGTSIGDDQPGHQVGADNQAGAEERGDDRDQTDDVRINLEVVGNSTADSCDDAVFAAANQLTLCHGLCSLS